MSVGKTAPVSFIRASARQPLTFLFLPTEIDRRRNASSGTPSGRQTSTPRAGISGGGPSTMRFPLQPSGVTSGVKSYPQISQTARPCLTTFSSVQRSDKPGRTCGSTDQEQEDFLKPACPGIHSHLQQILKTHQLVASGLQGI